MAHPLISSIHLLTLVAVLLLGHAMPRVGASKRICISLLKRSAMQNGDLGQPLTSYFARVDVGFWQIKTKTFNMLVDVSARENWLPIHLDHQDTDHARLNHKKGYENRLLNWGSQAPKEVFKIDFRGSGLEGKVWRDQFAFKDVTGSLAKVWLLQRFLVVSAASNDKFTRYEGVDGVLALHHRHSSVTGSVLRELAASSQIDELKFALTLDADLHTELGGELTFGAPDPLKFAGPLVYHPVVSQQGWAVSLESVMLGARPLAGCSRYCTAVLSTTINDIYAPTRAIQELLKLLGFSDVEHNFKSSSLYEIDCLKVADAPPLTFVIDGLNYALPPTSYIKEKKTPTCYVALLSNGLHNKWELGTEFLSHYHAVFDIDKRKVALGTRIWN